jgi:hypothetical protein
VQLEWNKTTKTLLFIVVLVVWMTSFMGVVFDFWSRKLIAAEIKYHTHERCHPNNKNNNKCVLDYRLETCRLQHRS